MKKPAGLAMSYAKLAMEFRQDVTPAGISKREILSMSSMKLALILVV
jgi:hypothetical protein